MVIMIFGISNVGKTVTGERLAEKFMLDNPYPHERYIIKGKVLKELLTEYKDNVVIAVSPIYHARKGGKVPKNGRGSWIKIA